MEFINGDLDQVFTVLYEMGKIEPLLQKDWKKLYALNHSQWSEVSSAINSLNSLQCKTDMRQYLESLPEQIVEALVVEVARELANFYDRKESVH